jgi:hypothetical protein
MKFGVNHRDAHPHSKMQQTQMPLMPPKQEKKIYCDSHQKKMMKNFQKASHLQTNL